MLQPLRLLAVFIELIAEFRVSDPDERLGAFADGFSMQVRDPMFGNDVADQPAGSDYSRARRKHWRDPRDRPALGCGRQRNDRLAAFGARCAPQKIHLPADSAIKMCADGVRTNLPG